MVIFMNAKYPKLKNSRQMLQKKTKDDIQVRNVMLIMVMGILADRFDFSASDLHDFMEDYNALADSLCDKYDNIKSMEKAIFDLYGIRVNEVRNDS